MSSCLHQHDYYGLKRIVIESIGEVLLKKYLIDNPREMIEAVVENPRKASSFDSFYKIPTPRNNQILFIFTVISRLEKIKTLSEQQKNNVLSAAVFYVMEDIRYSYRGSVLSFLSYSCTNSRLFTQLSNSINLNQTVVNNLTPDEWEQYKNTFKSMYNDLIEFFEKHSISVGETFNDEVDTKMIIQVSQSRADELSCNSSKNEKSKSFYKSINPFFSGVNIHNIVLSKASQSSLRVN